MRLCPNCLSPHHDQEHQRCEWCRFGQPMEDALSHPNRIPFMAFEESRAFAMKDDDVEYEVKFSINDG